MTKTKLSRRQLQVVKLMSRGEPSKVVAYILNISVRTVEAHAVAARNKYRARSMAQLIWMLRKIL